MNSIIFWAFIVLFSLAGLFFMAISIHAFCRKMRLAGAYCIFLSGIVFALEANPLREVFELSQSFFDGMMCLLAICTAGLFITVMYEWSGLTKA